jgi:membrane protein YdbS with pleckstrin-like domain
MRLSPRAARVLATLMETFWLMCLAVIAMFAFFLVLGAISPGRAITVTLVVAALAVLWIAHAVWRSRHGDGRDPDARRARERRGF